MSHPALPWSLLSLLLLASCNQDAGDPEKKAKDDPRRREAFAIEVTTAKERPLDELLSITAELVATREASISARLPGVPIKAVLADLGDPVEANQELVSLDREDLEQALAEAKLAQSDSELARADAATRLSESELAVRELKAEKFGQERVLAQARKVAARALKQAERGALSEEEVEARDYERDRELATLKRIEIQISKAEVQRDLTKQAIEKADLAIEQAALAVTKAERELTRSTIRTPIAGILIERSCEIGQLTASGQALFRLYDPTSLVAQVRLPQQSLRRVEVGLAVALKSEIWPEIVFSGKVERIAPTIDRENGIVELRIALDADKTASDPRNAARFSADDGPALRQRLQGLSLLRPGLFFTGDIILRRVPQALTVPRKAVGNLRGRSFLFVVEDWPADEEWPESESEPEGVTRGRVRREFISEGLSSGGFVQVAVLGSGTPLSPGTRVVLVGQDRLRDGDPVSIVRNPGAAAPDSSNR